MVGESRGERSAVFDAQALDHLDSLTKLSRQLVQNRNDAEDLVQEAYLHAFRAPERFTPGTNLRAWLRTILTNLARNDRRNRYRARVKADEAEYARAIDERRCEQASPEQLLLNDAIGPHLQRALESMPKALRDAVWLRDVEELSYMDMALRLRVPIGTVMSRISRGRRLFHVRMLALEGRSPAVGVVRR
jgi:RNA polymerase sigma-70 factor (ECF subfamily)